MFHDLSSAMRRVLMARERIARRTTFFASIMFNAKLIESNDQPSIWTDGIRIFFNPEYVESNDAFIEGDLLEVVMHNALLHPSRRKHRDLNKWNRATDLSVRPLVHQFFRQHPFFHQEDHNSDYAEKAAEEIYELLPDEPGRPGGGGAQSEGDDEGENGPQPTGGMVEPDPAQEQEAEDSAKQWARNTANAQDKATKAGNLPANIKRLIEELIPTDKLDWRDLARDMSRDAKSKSARSWSRVNRRRSDPPMPGYADDAIYNLIICFDVSGSIDDTMHQDMKKEVAALVDQDLVNQVTLIAVDTEPKSIEVVTNSDGVINWKCRGGGGTCFTSAMDLIKKDYPNSVGMLFLTDMETIDFGQEPPFPIVWVNFAPHNKIKAPFGRTVEY